MKTILLIEDYYDNARLVMRALKLYDYRIVHASDGESGLQMAVEEKPDLILVDWGLPDVEGPTLVPLLKNIPGLEQAPIVVVSAWPADKGKRMAQAYGCDGYIAKPISPRAFPSQIAAYFDPEDSE